MSSRLPPLNSLRAFEAAGRLRSVSRAAEELHVTAAAVSHQIKALEQHLGITLFRRLPRRIELTPAGKACLPKVTAAFSQLSEAVAAAQRSTRSGHITVNVAPALGTKWLAAKLPHFREHYPEIDLHIAVHPTMVDKPRPDSDADAGNLLENGDVAIRFGNGDYRGYASHKLFSSYSLPLCSPKLLNGKFPLRNPTDLRHHTLLHLENELALLDVGRPNWSTWLKAVNAEGVDSHRGLTFNDVTMVIEAAADGAGVALSVPLLAANDIASGRLIAPFSKSLPTGRSYYLLHDQTMELNPAIAAFRDWLMAEARDEPWAIPPDARVTPTSEATQSPQTS